MHVPHCGTQNKHIRAHAHFAIYSNSCIAFHKLYTCVRTISNVRLESKHCNVLEKKPI